ncbi:hypothetical protein J3F83DRAFT_727605 [Trichoderma novae-zelandiae]
MKSSVILSCIAFAVSVTAAPVPDSDVVASYQWKKDTESTDGVASYQWKKDTESLDGVASYEWKKE